MNVIRCKRTGEGLAMRLGGGSCLCPKECELMTTEERMKEALAAKDWSTLAKLVRDAPLRKGDRLRLAKISLKTALLALDSDLAATELFLEDALNYVKEAREK